MRWSYTTGALALSLAALGAVVLGLTPGSPRASAAGPCDVSTADISLGAEELEALAALASIRAGAGLRPLQVSLPLTRAAAWKANDLAAGATFSHTDSLGRTQHERAVDCGHAADAVGENIAGGFLDGNGVMDAWMASPAHYANIVAPQYVSVGIALAEGGIWALDFGLITDSATVDAGAPEPPGGSPGPVAPVAPSPAARGAGTSLIAGANLVTFAGEHQLASRAFRSIRAQLAGVYAWDEASGVWLRYLPDAPAYASSLEWLEPGARYVVVTTLAATWTLP